jgi:hypothetical protein
MLNAQYMCARPLQNDDTPKSKDIEVLSQPLFPSPGQAATTKFSVLTYKFQDDKSEPQTPLRNHKHIPVNSTRSLDECMIRIIMPSALEGQEVVQKTKAWL